MACWVGWWFVVIWLTLHGGAHFGVVCWVVASLGFLVVGVVCGCVAIAWLIWVGWAGWWCCWVVVVDLLDAFWRFDVGLMIVWALVLGRFLCNVGFWVAWCDIDSCFSSI